MKSDTTFTEVLKTIELIRDSFNGSVEVYTLGSCVKLCMILKHLHNDGKILYDSNHAIFELDGLHYDINGFAEKTKNHIPIEDFGLIKCYELMNLKATASLER